MAGQGVSSSREPKPEEHVAGSPGICLVAGERRVRIENEGPEIHRRPWPSNDVKIARNFSLRSSIRF